MINKKIFYQRTRDVKLFTTLTQYQVQCIDILIDEWDRTGIEDLKQFAYVLGTVYHETYIPKQPELRMTPVKEQGSEAYLKGKKYYPFIGMGQVQLTWETNYKRFGQYLKIDLINQPELALDPKISAKIAIYGMVNGKFTGVGLGRYFSSTKEDWVGARRIINGLDKAELIATYSKRFDQCLIEL